MSRERAIAACAPFPTPSRLIKHFPDLIGRNGPNNSAETHFTDKDFGKAIAMPASEAQLLSEIVTCAGADRLVEIGAYVGWSTAALLAGFEPFASQTLAVVDPFIESERTPGATEARFWENLDRVQPNGFTMVFRATSPDILPVVKPRHGWGFAFIDGKHTGGQPLRDIQGLLPCLTDTAVVVWHDAWLPDVKTAIDWLGDEGWTNVELPTANRMTISYKGDRPYWLDHIEAKAKEYTAVTHG